MSRHVSIVAKIGTRRASQKFLNEKSVFENSNLFHQLSVFVKLTALLWLLAGLVSLISLLSAPSRGLFHAYESYKAGNLLASGSSSWRPGEYSSGECGALQDQNMRRLDNESGIMQFILNPPPGYEKPYRQ